MGALTVADQWVLLPGTNTWIEEDYVRDLIPAYVLDRTPRAIHKPRPTVVVAPPVLVIVVPKLKAVPAPWKPLARNRGVSQVIPEDVLVAAHAMHMEGMSLRAIARDIFDDCSSVSHKALVNALSGTFNARGWEVRRRVEATAIANRRRAFRPYCSHILVLGERKGQRCERRCVGNDEWCWRHDPDRMAAKLAELHAQDAGRRAA